MCGGNAIMYLDIHRYINGNGHCKYEYIRKCKDKQYKNKVKILEGVGKNIPPESPLYETVKNKYTLYEKSRIKKFKTKVSVLSSFLIDKIWTV